MLNVINEIWRYPLVNNTVLEKKEKGTTKRRFVVLFKVYFLLVFVATVVERVESSIEKKSRQKRERDGLL